MKIIRSQKHERKVLDAVKEYLLKMPRSADKLHVSDLLYPRKTYWKKIDPKPMTDHEAGYFVAGRAHHGVIEAMFGPKADSKQADAGEFEKHGIYFSPDIRLPYPIEIKTSRANFAPNDNYEKHFDGYLKQLGSYQALMDSEKGGLLVFYLSLMDGKKRRPAFRFYKVLMDKQERTKKIKYLKALVVQLTRAITTKKWQGLELCPEWLCRDCQWFKQCKPWVKDRGRKKLQK